MTFPVVADRNNSEHESATTSHTVALPPNIAAGNRLVVTFVVDNNPTVTWPGGWTNVESGADAGSTSRTETRYRDADGTEGANITITTSTSQVSSHRSWRITGHDPATAPEGAGATGFSTGGNPPNLDPAGWGAEDTLWFAIEGNTASTTFTGFPTDYTDTFGQSSAGVTLGTAERSLNASAENPGAFAHGANTNWRAQTIAIRPAPPAAPRRRKRIWTNREAVQRW